MLLIIKISFIWMEQNIKRWDSIKRMQLKRPANTSIAEVQQKFITTINYATAYIKDEYTCDYIRDHYINDYMRTHHIYDYTWNDYIYD